MTEVQPLNQTPRFRPMYSRPKTESTVGNIKKTEKKLILEYIEGTTVRISGIKLHLQINPTSYSRPMVSIDEDKATADTPAFFSNGVAMSVFLDFVLCIMERKRGSPTGFPFLCYL